MRPKKGDFDYPVRQSLRDYETGHEQAPSKALEDYEFRKGQYKGMKINDVLRNVDGHYVGWLYKKSKEGGSGFADVLEQLIDNYAGEIAHAGTSAEDMEYVMGKYAGNKVYDVLSGQDGMYVFNLLGALQSSDMKKHEDLAAKLNSLVDSFFEKIGEMARQEQKQMMAGLYAQ